LQKRLCGSHRISCFIQKAQGAIPVLLERKIFKYRTWLTRQKKRAKMCQSRRQLLHAINNLYVRNMDESSTLKDLQFDLQLVLGGKRSLPVATLLERLKVISSYNRPAHLATQIKILLWTDIANRVGGMRAK
jgi:hypothetical protein